MARVILKKLLDITVEYELWYDSMQLITKKKGDTNGDTYNYFNTTKGVLDSFKKKGIAIEADKIAALNRITTSFKHGHIIVKVVD